MKILTLIPNFGNGNISYLKNLLENLNLITSIDFDIILFSTQYNDSLTDLIKKEIVCPESIGTNLTLEPYRYLATNSITDYDYIFYTENDLLFTEQNFTSFFKWHEKLKPTAVPGFVRYEVKDSTRYLVDAHELPSPPITMVDFKEYVQFSNTHAGCWLLSTSQYTILMLKGLYPGHTMEDRASNVYKGPWPGSDIGFPKLIPCEDFENFLIHHQPNKYCHVYPTGQPTVDSYLEQFNETPH